MYLLLITTRITHDILVHYNHFPGGYVSTSLSEIFQSTTSTYLLIKLVQALPALLTPAHLPRSWEYPIISIWFGWWTVKAMSCWFCWDNQSIFVTIDNVYFYPASKYQPTESKLDPLFPSLSLLHKVLTYNNIQLPLGGSNLYQHTGTIRRF